MEREVRIGVGVIGERRKARSKWADDIWVPVAAVAGQTAMEPGAVVIREKDFTRYFLGRAEVCLYASDTEAYVHNLESVQPALFVILRRDDANESPLPYVVHAVTLSPYEAQDHEDSAEDIVARVAVPPSIAIELLAFVEEHHVEHEFNRRKRKDPRPEGQRFGQEPVFARKAGHHE